MMWRVVMVVGLLAVASVRAATLRYAAGVDQASVSNAIISSVNGDPILIPEGTATWTNTLIRTNRVFLIGANTPTLTNQTRITISTPSTPLGFQGVSPSDTNKFGVSFLTMDLNASEAADFGINIGASTQTTNYGFKLHHLHFHNIAERAINTLGLAQGLVSSNYFRQPFNNNAQAMTFQGWARAGAAITQARKTVVAFGTESNYVYAEGNKVHSDFANDSSFELYRDAQVVGRSNYFGTTSGVHDHNGARCAPLFEFYGNQWIDMDGIDFSGVRWLVVRTGIGPIYNNTITTPATPTLTTNVTVQYYRAHGTNTFQNNYSYSHVATAPSPPASGTTLNVTLAERFRFLDSDTPQSGFPKNVVIWPAGAQMSAGSYEVATATAYEQSTGQFTLTRGSPARTILVGDQFAESVINAVTGTNIWDFNANNVTTIGHPALDQFGWSDPVTWTATNATMTFYGGWSWDNNVNGNTNVMLAALNEGSNAGLLAYDGVRTLPQTSDLIVEGRDVFSNTVMTNYTALGRHSLAYYVTLDPASTNVTTGTTVNFTATENQGQTWFILWVNNSGATINESTGEYTAGAVPGVVDTVRVVDQIGGSYFASVSVDAPLAGSAPGYSANGRRRIM